MCLGIPAQVVSITDKIARVSVSGAELNVGLQLMENIAIGEWVLVHAGFALQKLSEEEALETLALFAELEACCQEP